MDRAFLGTDQATVGADSERRKPMALSQPSRNRHRLPDIMVHLRGFTGKTHSVTIRQQHLAARRSDGRQQAGHQCAVG